MNVRAFFTKWIGDAWDELKSRPELILKTFKRCGFANDMNGRENHLVRLRHVYWYNVPPESYKAKTYPDLTGEQILEGENRIREFRKLSKTERQKIINKKRKSSNQDLPK